MFAIKRQRKESQLQGKKDGLATACTSASTNEFCVGDRVYKVRTQFAAHLQKFQEIKAFWGKMC